MWKLSSVPLVRLVRHIRLSLPLPLQVHAGAGVDGGGGAVEGEGEAAVSEKVSIPSDCWRCGYCVAGGFCEADCGSPAVLWSNSGVQCKPQPSQLALKPI